MHSFCDCGCEERQDEKHVLLACRLPQVCTLREVCSDLFGGFSSLSPDAGVSFTWLFYTFGTMWGRLSLILEIRRCERLLTSAGSPCMDCGMAVL